MQDSFQQHMLQAISAAVAAGEAILNAYRKPGLHQEIKKDLSPVTEADLAAHKIIADHLLHTGLPILSEEGKNIPFEERRNWRQFWLVDPLDGTREFLGRNGEFTVNIALIEGQKPIMGILYAPCLDLVYFSDLKAGAYRMEACSKRWHEIRNVGELMEASEKLPLKNTGHPYRVVASRSHINQETEDYIRDLKNAHPGLEVLSRGSALKFCQLAEGSADVYPRFGPTMEWDTGAGHAIALASGCRLTLHNSADSLVYNKESLLNPWFIVQRD